jgi:hypothetical protein
MAWATLEQVQDWLVTMSPPRRRVSRCERSGNPCNTDCRTEPCPCFACARERGELPPAEDF